MIAVGQHASPCGQCAGQWRARAIRRAQRQYQNQNGEKYAAYWVCGEIGSIARE